MADSQMGDVKAALEFFEQHFDTEKRIDFVGEIPVAIMPSGGSLHVLDKILALEEARASKPRRLAGIATHTEVESFIAHTNRFKDEHSVVFADVEKVKLTTVFDYHQKGPSSSGVQRWGGHRSVYACPLSKQWKLWTENEGREFRQLEFAEFIDANRSDVAGRPEGAPISEDVAAPADLISMARGLVINTKGVFERRINETTGESTLVAKTEHAEGSTKIPRAFLLKLPVFEAGAKYGVEARIRFSLNGGVPIFAYLLVESDLVLRDAFGEVRKRVTDETGLPIFAGTPE